MSLPPSIDQKIRQRFAELLSESEQLITNMTEAVDEASRRDRESHTGFAGVYQLDPDQFVSLQTRFLSLIELFGSESKHLVKFSDEVRSLKSSIRDAKKLAGYIHGLKNDYESGILQDLAQMIEANVAADYLGQAEQLLKGGQPGQYDHVPAAVLTGAILEDALRRLCQRQNPPIPVEKPNGEPKTLNTLIDDLKKANVYNELKAKQLRSWADIRNAAAHGEFGKFNRQDVEQMLVGVQNFLAEYL